jgi:hypothetical protein
MLLRWFFLLALLLGVTIPPLAQADREGEADRLSDKLWRVIDITKQYAPQFQAHVTLEAPDGERLALTLQGENARTLIHDDVIALDRKPDVHGDIPEQEMGPYFIPRIAKWGKPRWFSERLKHEGREIRRAWELFLLQIRVREPEL